MKHLSPADRELRSALNPRPHGEQDFWRVMSTKEGAKMAADSNGLEEYVVWRWPDGVFSYSRVRSKYEVTVPEGSVAVAMSFGKEWQDCEISLEAILACGRFKLSN